MRLISDFKDYYDGLLSYDQDYETVYVRKNNCIELKRKYSSLLTSRNDVFEHEKISYKIQHDIIGFCGKVYPRVYGVSSSYVCPSIELIYFKGITKVEGPIASLVRELRKDDTWKILRENQERKEREDESEAMKVFEGYDADSFRISIQKGKYVLELNPCMEDLGFPSVLDSFSAYQTLDAWISNKSVNKDIDLTSGSDEDLAEAKGFDRKYSFRKAKKK